MAEVNYGEERPREAAREAFDQAVLNYSNAIKEARLQNSSALAQIAYQALLTQLELIRQGLGHPDQPLTEQPDRKPDARKGHRGRYMDVLGQIHTENALTEEQPC